MTQKWRIKAQETLYQGFFQLQGYQLEVSRFQGGHLSMRREMLWRAPVAAVLPYDPERQRLLLVEQFRVGAMHDRQHPWLVELVAGVCEPGESLPDLARRELQEEAGVQAQDLQLIHTYYPSPGGCNEKVSVYFAETPLVDVGGVHGLAEEGEDILVHLWSIEQAWQALQAGSLDNAMALVALQWFFLHHPDGVAHRRDS